MRLHALLGSVSALVIGACASTVKVPEIPLSDTIDYAPAIRKSEAAPEPAAPVIEVLKLLPLPGQLKAVAPIRRPAKDDLPPKDRVSAANAAARIEPVKDGYINAIQVYPFTEGALYQLYAGVNQVTDIALEAGETLIAVSAGDTVRWVVADTTSGQGSSARIHILVKPIGTDLETNLVITTSRRTYHLEMHASSTAYMASVSWTYPASALKALEGNKVASDGAEAATAGPGIDLEELRFRYRIEGDAPWKPRQVFDDGAKVYIQFPPGLAQSEAPPLFVTGSDGKPALVNYRVRGTTYIVDRLFAAAELRLGTSPQRVVRIVRTDAVWREAKP